MAHYKYKLLHVLTGNYIHVCYDDRITNKTISRRIKAWNKLPHRGNFTINNSGICGFFLSIEDYKNDSAVDMTQVRDRKAIKILVGTNKKLLEKLITTYNFRFDIAMDLYNTSDIEDAIVLTKRKKQNNFPLSSEFEIVRIK